MKMVPISELTSINIKTASSLESIINAAQDPVAFLSLFNNLTQLEKAVKTYPAHADQLFDRLLQITVAEQDKVERPASHRFMHVSGFVQLALIFPGKKQRLFELIMEMKNFHPFIYTSFRALANLAEAYNDAKMHARLFEKSGLQSGDAYKKLVVTAPALIELALAFPLYQDKLLAPVLSDPEERARLIMSRHDLMALGKAFPGQQLALLNSCLKDATVCKRITKSLADLLELGKVFPDYQTVLVDFVLNDPTAYARYFTDGFELAEFGKVFTVRQEAVLAPLLNDPIEYKKKIRCLPELKELGMAYPNHQAALIDPVLTRAGERTRIITNAQVLVELGNAFPGQHSALLEPVLIDPAEYQRVIKNKSDLQQLGLAFPNSHVALIGPVLNIGVERSRIISNAQDLVALCKAFPEHQSALLEPVLNEPAEYARVVKDVYYLKELGLAFPDSHAALIGPVLNGGVERSRFNTDANHLVTLGTAFPTQQAEILEPVLSDPTEYDRIINSANQLAGLGKAFPAQQAALLVPVLKNPVLLRKIVCCREHFCMLGNAFPNFQAELLAPFLSDADELGRISNGQQDFAFLAEAFPAGQRQLLGCILQDAKYAQYFENVNYLVQLGKAFTNCHAMLIEPILNDPVKYRALIKNGACLATLANAFPVYRLALLAPLLNDTTERMRIIKDASDLREVFKEFPEQQSELLMPVLTNPAERARLIKSNGDLVAANVFRGYQTALLCSALNDPAERARLVPDCESLLALSKAFPDNKAILIELVLTDLVDCLRLIADCERLRRVLLAFPEHKNYLLNKILNNEALLTQFVQRYGSLEFLHNQFPDQHQAIGDAILNNTIFRLAIKNTSDIHILVRLIPDKVALIFARIAAIGFHEFEIWNSFWKMEMFVNDFPAYQAEIFNALFNNIEAFTKLLDNVSESLTKVCTLFPAQKQKIMLFAVRYAPGRASHVLELMANKRVDTDIVTICIEELEAAGADQEKANAELARWKTAIAESNQMLTAFQQITYAAVINLYKPRILRLMFVMGPARAIEFLATITSISVKQLEQFLGSPWNMSIKYFRDFLNLLLNKFAASLSDKKKILIWKEILLSLCALSLLDYSSSSTKCADKLKQLSEKIEDADLADVSAQLTDVSRTCSFDLLALKIDANDMIDRAKFNMLTGSRFWTALVTGKRALSYYKGWYDAMLLCDITTRSLDALLHDTQQTDAGTRVIAEHNANIRTKLKKFGLKREAAIHFKKSHAFTFDETIKINIDWQLLANKIKEQLSLVKASLSNSTLLNNRQIKGLYNKVANLLQELSKGNNDNAKTGERVQSPTIRDSLINLHEKLRTLNDIITASPDSGELVGELAALDKSLAEFIASQPKIHTRQFRAKQWDKTRSDTFYLGSYFSCCLAPDGSQAQAIIERRLDDAMPIHVVMDEETDEPVCAVWLFWAKDNNDEQLKLVANYFELSHAYSKDELLRQTLVANLMYFTGELYTKAVAHRDVTRPPLLMRHLTYGKISDFTEFKEVQCRFSDKLGGFCLSENSQKTRYYLAGLERVNFHIFSMEGLQAEFPKVSLPKTEVALSEVKATLFANSASVATHTSGRARVIRRHRV